MLYHRVHPLFHMSRKLKLTSSITCNSLMKVSLTLLTSVLFLHVQDSSMHYNFFNCHVKHIILSNNWYGYTCHNKSTINNITLLYYLMQFLSKLYSV